MDPISIPSTGSTGEQLSAFEVDTYGVFDPFRRDYSAVVGWKLQDLVSIQSPARGQPENLGPPSNCSFDLETNLQASAQPTSLASYLATMTWTSQGMICVWFIFSLLILAPCLCWWFFCCHQRTGASNTARTWSSKQFGGNAYQTLNELGKPRTNGNIIDARPVHPIGTYSGPPGEDCNCDSPRSNFFSCCSGSGRPVHKFDRVTAEVMSRRDLMMGQHRDFHIGS